MAGSDGKALVMISHEGVDRHEVEAVLRRRWPDVVVKSVEQDRPAVAMSPSDAADPGQRGVEPLRIVVMPLHERQTITLTVIQPMPVVV